MTYQQAIEVLNSYTDKDGCIVLDLRWVENEQGWYPAPTAENLDAVREAAEAVAVVRGGPTGLGQVDAVTLGRLRS